MLLEDVWGDAVPVRVSTFWQMRVVPCWLTFLFLQAWLRPSLPLQTSANNTRVAVCFWGLTRSLWATRDSLRFAVFDPLYKEGFQVHKFLHTFQIEEESGHKIAWDDYKWLDIPAENVAVEGLTSVDTTEDTPSLEAISVHGDLWGDNGYSIKNHRLALHSLKSVTLLWSADPQSFDIVLYTRTDLWFFQPLNISEVYQVLLSAPTIFTPGWDSWDGYNDRFAFGHPKLMLPYGCRLRVLPQYVESNPVHAETFLKWIVKQEGVEARPSSIRFTRVRASGEIWSLPAQSAGQLESSASFSDDEGHEMQPQTMRLRRNHYGFLEVVPCSEGCDTSGTYG